MSDDDYILKAVELADGWSARMQEWGHDIVGPDSLDAYALCEGIPLPVLDALATQLIRQSLQQGFDVHIDIQGSNFSVLLYSMSEIRVRCT
jgi:hypothetical protein